MVCSLDYSPSVDQKKKTDKLWCLLTYSFVSSRHAKHYLGRHVLVHIRDFSIKCPWHGYWTLFMPLQRSCSLRTSPRILLQRRYHHNLHLRRFVRSDLRCRLGFTVWKPGQGEYVGWLEDLSRRYDWWLMPIPFAIFYLISTNDLYCIFKRSLYIFAFLSLSFLPSPLHYSQSLSNYPCLGWKHCSDLALDL